MTKTLVERLEKFSSYKHGDPRDDSLYMICEEAAQAIREQNKAMEPIAFWFDNLTNQLTSDDRQKFVEVFVKYSPRRD